MAVLKNMNIAVKQKFPEYKNMVDYIIGLDEEGDAVIEQWNAPGAPPVDQAEIDALVEQYNIAQNIDAAKWVTRNKIAAIINPVTGLPMSSETTKAAIERDLEHGFANQQMVMNLSTAPESLKNQIKTSHKKAVDTLSAAALVYQEIRNNVNYDYVNSPHWPEE